MKYEKISPTAETIAFIRSGLNIPYADQIAELCSAEKVTMDFYHRPDFDADLARIKKLSCWAKMRLLSMIGAIHQSGIANVLEIASGFSPAGLIISEDRRINYLETDLPEVVCRKRTIAEHIAAGRKNLNFFAASALDKKQLENATMRFQDGPLVVMHEGLWQYLTRDEKLIVASNINELLKFRGGIWVTPDVVLKSHFISAFNTSDYSKRIRTIIAENTGRDMVEMAFDSYDEAERLIKNAGFSVEKHAQLELLSDPISSHDIAKRKNLQHQQLWIMRCA